MKKIFTCCLFIILFVNSDIYSGKGKFPVKSKSETRGIAKKTSQCDLELGVIQRYAKECAQGCVENIDWAIKVAKENDFEEALKYAGKLKEKCSFFITIINNLPLCWDQKTKTTFLNEVIGFAKEVNNSALIYYKVLTPPKILEQNFLGPFLYVRGRILKLIIKDYKLESRFEVYKVSANIEKLSFDV